ncbi:hypothetical protein CR513_14478, partial [Mucuna pruriens]
MRLMNHVLRSLIGKCVVVYFDDNLIYSTCLNDHLLYVKNKNEHFVPMRLPSLALLMAFIKSMRKSILATSINKIVKESEESQERTFQALKEKLTQTLILSLSKFSKSFELECDNSSVGIWTVILQEGYPIAYISEKLKGLTYSIANLAILSIAQGVCAP